MNEKREQIDQSLDWKPLTEHPSRNGWYEMWMKRPVPVYKKNGEGKRVRIGTDYVDEPYLGLYRDGKWLKVPSYAHAWRGPMVRSDMTKPYIKHPDAVMALATALARDYSNDYESAFELMLTERIGTERWINANLNFLRAKRYMEAEKYQIITMGAADPEDVMLKLRKRVFKRVWKYDNQH